MEWKTKLFQILKCFEDNEGTWFEREWKSYGISQEEAEYIKHEYEEWRKT